MVLYNEKSKIKKYDRLFVHDATSLFSTDQDSTRMIGRFWYQQDLSCFTNLLFLELNHWYLKKKGKLLWTIGTWLFRVGFLRHVRTFSKSLEIFINYSWLLRLYRDLSCYEAAAKLPIRQIPLYWVWQLWQIIRVGFSVLAGEYGKKKSIITLEFLIVNTFP
jgi:hypothetical protein